MIEASNGILILSPYYELHFQTSHAPENEQIGIQGAHENKRRQEDPQKEEAKRRVETLRERRNKPQTTQTIAAAPLDLCDQ